MTEAGPEVLVSIARRSDVTGIGWRSLSHFYKLPKALKGLRCLDLCAGMSDFALNLRQRGAQAYALDLLYGDLAALSQRHREGFREVARDVFHTTPESLKGRKIYQEYVGAFQVSLHRKPCIYVGGSVTALPFPDASFDLVTSFNGIFGTLDLDQRALALALKEAVRVLRPGGALQLIPYLRGPILSDLEKLNQREVVDLLAHTEGLDLTESLAHEGTLLGGNIALLTITKVK